jgi:hypothetical protein
MANEGFEAEDQNILRSCLAPFRHARESDATAGSQRSDPDLAALDSRFRGNDANKGSRRNQVFVWS